LYEHNDDHEQCVLDIHNTTSNIVCSKKWPLWKILMMEDVF
jgi:hypothetical protein